jgi:hypothetical protein
VLVEKWVWVEEETKDIEVDKIIKDKIKIT